MMTYLLKISPFLCAKLNILIRSKYYLNNDSGLLSNLVLTKGGVKYVTLSQLFFGRQENRQKLFLSKVWLVRNNIDPIFFFLFQIHEYRQMFSFRNQDLSNMIYIHDLELIIINLFNSYCSKFEKNVVEYQQPESTDTGLLDCVSTHFTFIGQTTYEKAYSIHIRNFFMEQINLKINKLKRHQHLVLVDNLLINNNNSNSQYQQRDTGIIKKSTTDLPPTSFVERIFYHSTAILLNRISYASVVNKTFTIDTDESKQIGLFANIFVPNTFSSKYLQYIFCTCVLDFVPSYLESHDQISLWKLFVPCQTSFTCADILENSNNLSTLRKYTFILNRHYVFSENFAAFKNFFDVNTETNNVSFNPNLTVKLKVFTATILENCELENITNLIHFDLDLRIKMYVSGDFEMLHFMVKIKNLKWIDYPVVSSSPPKKNVDLIFDFSQNTYIDTDYEANLFFKNNVHLDESVIKIPSNKMYTLSNITNIISSQQMNLSNYSYDDDSNFVEGVMLFTIRSSSNKSLKILDNIFSLNIRDSFNNSCQIKFKFTDTTNRQ